MVLYNISHCLYVVLRQFWFRKMDRVFLSPKLGLGKRLFQNQYITATTVQFNYVQANDITGNKEASSFQQQIL